MVNIGPPRGAFPIASLFILLALFVSMYALYIAGAFSPYIRNLAFGTLFLMFAYVLVGDWFAKKGGTGQLLFLGLGLVFVIFADTLMNVLHIELELVPSFSFAGVALTYNGSDVTWLLPVAFIVALYFTQNDWKRWIKGEF